MISAGRSEVNNPCFIQIHYGIFFYDLLQGSSEKDNKGTEMDLMKCPPDNIYGKLWTKVIKVWRVHYALSF